MTSQIDIFPIEYDLAKHPLTAYRLVAPNTDEAGGVFAARVRKMTRLPAIWLRGQNCLVTSEQFTLARGKDLLTQLHQMALPHLKNTTAIEALSEWEPTPAVIAQYVAEGVLDSAYDEIADALKSKQVDIGNIQVLRQVHFKGLVVQDTDPAIQITLRSVMSTRQTLEDYLRQHDAESVKADGLAIKCRRTNGTFDGIVGRLDDLSDGGISHRDRLKGYNPSDYPSTWLDSLPGDHLVVALKPNYGKFIYHYPIKALKLVVSMANLHHFTKRRDEQREIAGHLKIAPEVRYEIVQQVSQTVQKYFQRERFFIKLLHSYTEQEYPQYFSSAAQLGFNTELRFGDRTLKIDHDSQMIPSLQRAGVYKLHTPSIRVAFVDAIPGESHKQQRFVQLKRLRDHFSELGITLGRATEILQVSETDASRRRAELRRVLREAITKNPDVILVYLPQSDRDTHSSDDLNSLYNVAKSVTIGAGVASQVIYQKTLETDYADANIIMGILGKTGNIPYVLANPLPFADIVVGLDIGRRRLNNGGSLNMGAMSRIYLHDGHLLGYNLASGNILDGETIPTRVLETIFPPEEFVGKRVIVHRDGRFPNPELESLMNWGDEIGAKLYPIEVTKSGSPRMYKLAQGVVKQADKQSIFYLDSQTAFIVTSPPPAFKNAAKTTAQPLKIRNLSALTLDQALLSVISLTLLHYGSVRPPRLPVSTHASDKIAGFYLRDIRPGQTKGDKPFWL